LNNGFVRAYFHLFSLEKKVFPSNYIIILPDTKENVIITYSIFHYNQLNIIPYFSCDKKKSIDEGDFATFPDQGIATTLS
jgi:hypothetical protein